MVITASVLGPLLRSHDSRTIKLAVEAIWPVLAQHRGNLLRVAAATGIAHRTLVRWLKCIEFKLAVIEARGLANIA